MSIASTSPPTSAPKMHLGDVESPTGWRVCLTAGSCIVVLAMLVMTMAIQTRLQYTTPQVDLMRPQNARQLDRNYARTSQITIQIASRVMMIVGGLTGLAFLAWFYRMHHNLWGLETAGRMPTLVWVCLLFIPGVNAVAVVPALLDLWSKSDPGRVDGSEKPKQPTVIFVWWMLGAACLIIELYLMMQPPDLADMDQRLTFVIFRWTVMACAFAQQVLFLLMLNDLHAFQKRRKDLLLSLPISSAT